MLRTTLRALWVSWLVVAAVAAQNAVPTWQYNRRRTGADPYESRLTPATVNPRRFGKLFRFALDGAVYAQPLYLAHLAIPGQGRHNVVFLATEAGSVYAFDAAGRPRRPLWHVRFANPAAGVTVVTARQTGCGQIEPDVGITATPVLDPVRGVLYVIVRTWEKGRFVQRLHALSVRTGVEMPHSPVLIQASLPGDGDGSRNGRVWFDPQRNNARAALLLSGGQVYAAFASPCDAIPFHGWLLAYDARTLRRTAVFTPSPNSNDGGIWQSGAGPAARGGRIFAAVGNGGFDARGDYGDSLLALTPALRLAGSFTPADHHALNLGDKDLGSGGPVLLPGGLAVIAGKSGTIYLLHQSRLGGLDAAQPQGARQAVEAVRGRIGEMAGSPAWWRGNLYFAAAGHRLAQFHVRGGRLDPRPVARTREKFYYPGATPVVSSDQGRAGIVWAIQLGHAQPGLLDPAVLHAYLASNVARELYSSQWNPARDTAGRGVRFVPPLVARGRVYVPTQHAVAVYGER